MKDAGRGNAVRNVIFVLFGVSGLLLKRHYRGPAASLVHDYGGNFSVSFAVYFMLLQLPVPDRYRSAAAAFLAFAATALFEATNGFGVMQNTYDPWDFAANAAGIGFAAGLSLLPGLRPSRNPGTGP